MRGSPIAFDAQRLARCVRKEVNNGAQQPGSVHGIFATGESCIPAGSLLGVVPLSCSIDPSTTSTTLGSQLGELLERAHDAQTSASLPRDVSLVTCATACHLIIAANNERLDTEMSAAQQVCPPHHSSRRSRRKSSQEGLHLFISRYFRQVSTDVISNREQAEHQLRSSVQWKDSTAIRSRYARLVAAREGFLAEMQSILIAASTMWKNEHSFSWNAPGRHSSWEQNAGAACFSFIHDILQAHPRRFYELIDVAHALCESRCVTVGKGEDDRGEHHSVDGRVGGDVDDDGAIGPALIPLVDLLNHSSLPPNVSIAAITDAKEVSRILRIAARRTFIGATECAAVADNPPSSQHHGVFAIVAATDLHNGDELHFQYISADEQASTLDYPQWALRFHFLP